jgi:hypothetical protein
VRNRCGNCRHFRRHNPPGPEFVHANDNACQFWGLGTESVPGRDA